MKQDKEIMKKLEFKTSRGEFILEEASDKNLGRVLVKYMTEEQFAEVVEMQRVFNPTNPYCIDDIVYKNYTDDEWVWSSKESFESLIKSLGWYLFENPYKNFADEMGCEQAESKTLYNPILLKKT